MGSREHQPHPEGIPGQLSGQNALWMWLVLPRDALWMWLVLSRDAIWMWLVLSGRMVPKYPMIP